jgi:hypothetical protein
MEYWKNFYVNGCLLISKSMAWCLDKVLLHLCKFRNLNLDYPNAYFDAMMDYKDPLLTNPISKKILDDMYAKRNILIKDLSERKNKKLDNLEENLKIDENCVDEMLDLVNRLDDKINEYKNAADANTNTEVKETVVATDHIISELDTLLVDGKSDIENIVQQVIDENDQNIEGAYKEAFDDAKYYAIENPDFDIIRSSEEAQLKSKIELENAKMSDMLDDAIQQYSETIKSALVLQDINLYNDTTSNAMSKLLKDLVNIEKELECLEKDASKLDQSEQEITEIGADAIDALRDAIYNIQKEVAPKPVKKKTNRRSSPGRSNIGKNQRLPRATRTKKPKKTSKKK